MKTKKLVTAAIVSAIAARSFASGFALYQPSAVSHAMGGALVGKAMDASANFNNPATLTDLTNITVSVGFVTEHPRGRVDARMRGSSYHEYKMDPGLFWLPHVQLAVPLPFDFAFGLGIGADYGLGSKYHKKWLMDWSATETTIEGLVINPNLAYKITDKWSVGAGLRWLFFDFEQYSYPQVPMNGVELARFKNHITGDNDFKDFGWQIGTKYDITDTFSVGVVYKSEIDVKVRGRSRNRVVRENNAGIRQLATAKTYQTMMESGYTPAQIAMIPAAVKERYISTADATIRSSVSSEARKRTGRGGCDLSLPQSIAGGFNWDVYPTWHIGAMVSWTQWGEFGNLYFDLPPDGKEGDRDIKMDWRDTWRFSIGSCWDFAEDWRWMVSYTYDMDSTRSTQQSVMLPPANRHILGTGFTWNCWGGFELALSYACIFMDGRDMHMDDALGNTYDLETDWGFCHAGGFSVTYRF
ncbi:MAG: outer membrane protein transport protein [Kiritimatiellae bacterium]|nr:outer membrane protein transport protein [Kiritimatiellia bacterium]